ncbi:MAG: hypothetical protein ACK5T8_04085, partial [Alphaproteobacteria bacterium]
GGTGGEEEGGAKGASPDGPGDHVDISCGASIARRTGIAKGSLTLGGKRHSLRLSDRSILRPAPMGGTHAD